MTSKKGGRIYHWIVSPSRHISTNCKDMPQPLIRTESLSTCIWPLWVFVRFLQNFDQTPKLVNNMNVGWLLSHFAMIIYAIPMNINWYFYITASQKSKFDFMFSFIGSKQILQNKYRNTDTDVYVLVINTKEQWALHIKHSYQWPILFAT